MSDFSDSFFSINYSIHLGEDGEPDDCFTRYRGEIVQIDDKSGEEKVVGRIKAAVAQVANHPNYLAEVFDCAGREEQIIYSTLFNKNDFFNAAARRALRWGEAHATNLLLLESVEILPEARGQNLGLAALDRTIRYLGVGCSVAALIASPLQDSDHSDKEWAKQMRYEEMSQNRPVARRKLIALYQKLGFVCVGKTGVMVRECGHPWGHREEI